MFISQVDLICPKPDGLAPHPSDCSKFLNCYRGYPAVQTCGPGTVFNPKILTCDWPHNVNCNQDQSFSGKSCKMLRSLSCLSKVNFWLKPLRLDIFNKIFSSEFDN